VIAQTAPIIVKLVDPKKDGLYEVMVGALGVTGVMVVVAVVAAIVLAGVLFWRRSRNPLEH
jgi:high-affinity Fe2+/Pb2+ permease